MDEQVKLQENQQEIQQENLAAQAPAVEPVEDLRPVRPFLYRFRGLILAIAAVVALIIPPADLAIVPFLAVTRMVEPGGYLPATIAFAIGLSRSRCIALFTGRAPNAGS